MSDSLAQMPTTIIPPGLWPEIALRPASGDSHRKLTRSQGVSYVAIRMMNGSMAALVLLLDFQARSSHGERDGTSPLRRRLRPRCAQVIAAVTVIGSLLWFALAASPASDVQRRMQLLDDTEPLARPAT